MIVDLILATSGLIDKIQRAGTQGSRVIVETHGLCQEPQRLQGRPRRPDQDQGHVLEPGSRRSGHGTSAGVPGRTFLLDIHYRAHPGVDTALELVHPGGKPLDLDGITGDHDSRQCQAGCRWG